MPIVSVVQVGKSFGAERIFAGVNFQINEQDRIGLIGPNGAGKSTISQELFGATKDVPLDRARVADQFASRPPPFRRPLVFHCSAPRGSSSQIFEDGRKCWRGLIPKAPKGIRGPLPQPARGHKPVAGRAPPQMGPQRFAGPRAAFPRSCRKERRSPGLPPTIL